MEQFKEMPSGDEEDMTMTKFQEMMASIATVTQDYHECIESSKGRLKARS